jgi:hypothetical protein
MARFWLGPWVLASASGNLPARWEQPAGSLACLDLRSEPQCANMVTPEGHALFVTANATNLGANYTNLGTDPDLILSGPQKASWQSRFELPNALTAQTVREAIWETCTIQADPTGEDRCRPFMPNSRGNFAVWLGGGRVMNVPFSIARPEWTPVIDQLKRIYRRTRQQCLDGIAHPDHYKKVLGWWVRKYQRPYREFQPLDLPDEEPLEPSTTLTEVFTGDDDALGPNLSWTETNGDIDRVSGQAKGIAAANNRARADSDLSSDDHFVQATCITLLGDGICVQFASAADSCYAMYNDFFSTRLFKVTAGGLSSLATWTTVSGASSVCKLEIDGGAMEGYDDTVSVGTVSDSTWAGNTRCGIWNDINTTIDNWSAEDIGAPAGRATKNTRAFPLGVAIGMDFNHCNI